MVRKFALDFGTYTLAFIYACGTWLNKQIWPPSWATLTFVYIFVCFSFRISVIRARPVPNERL